ncbi:MAG: transporter, family, inner rane transport protein [Frankiaceae bacterium]|nr:transporter, family, inner rane transport protein [Frankiaceae bacterium]
MSLDALTRSGPSVESEQRRSPAWLSIGSLAIGGFAIGTTEFVSMGVLPQIAADVHATIPAAGHLITAYALGVVVGAPMLAMLGARLARKTQLLLLICGIAVGNLLSALAPSYDTLLVARFLSGLPHGAYFGVGGVVAASLVAPERRGRAMSNMMLGLTIANIVGVPISTLLGQSLGWRSTYWAVTVIAAVTAIAIARNVPYVPAHDGANIRSELTALRRMQVWLTLITGAIGFGGFFAVYSYITPTLTEVSHYKLVAVPIVLSLFGVGMTIGNVVGGRLADWSIPGAIYIGLSSVIATLLVFTHTAHSLIAAGATVFVLGGTGSLMIPALQTRLMDAAHHGQNLAGSLNHSALNLANALGAFLGGLVIAQGYGYTAPAVVGAALATGGIGVFTVAVLTARRTQRAAPSLG